VRPSRERARHVSLAALALALACAPARSTNTSSPGTSSSGTTSSSSIPPAATSNPAGCPPTWTANTCDKSRASILCTYPENHACRCEPPFSGGAAPDPNAPWVWACAVAVRPDGCPGLPPIERTHCDAPGRACSYPGVYANDYFVLECQKGAWWMTKLPQPTP